MRVLCCLLALGWSAATASAQSASPIRYLAGVPAGSPTAPAPRVPEFVPPAPAPTPLPEKTNDSTTPAPPPAVVSELPKARSDVSKPVDPKDPRAWLWEYRLAGFGEKDYRAAVDALFADFESRFGKKLEPGAKRRAGLKLATGTVGLTTPPALTRAVIAALVSRGFKPGELFLVDQSESRLRAAGYLPGPGAANGETFEGVPILVLERGKYYDPVTWFYDSPLPAPDSTQQAYIRNQFDWKIKTNDRLSLLPVPLLLDVDFWINLPVGIDQPQLGVSGALVNASLYLCNNTERFLQNPATGAVAVAQMAAIPELSRGLVVSLLSLERYQFIGGPRFNALYTESEPTLLMSSNPVILDSILFDRINLARSRARMPLLDQPAYLEYSRQVGLGDFSKSRIFLTRLPK